jgi:hypothetical protein
VVNPFVPTVQVRNVRTNAVESITRRIKVDVAGIALSPSFVALLVPVPHTQWLRLLALDRRTGAKKRLPAIRTGESDVSVAGSKIVLLTGRTIRLVDASTGKTFVVAKAAAAPIGLSIEGRRIAWAENIGGRGRIRGVLLPRNLPR